MEDTAVREHAEAHGQAIVDGDLRRASHDLTSEAMAAAAPVMAALPHPTTGAAVDSLREEGDEHVVVIRYSGEGSEVLVESRWGEVEGRPKIQSLKLL
jgi:hypothetical protein